MHDDTDDDPHAIDARQILEAAPALLAASPLKKAPRTRSCMAPKHLEPAQVDWLCLIYFQLRLNPRHAAYQLQLFISGRSVPLEERGAWEAWAQKRADAYRAAWLARSEAGSRNAREGLAARKARLAAGAPK